MKNRTLLLNASETHREHTSDMAFIKDIDGVYLRTTKAFAAMTDAKTVERLSASAMRIYFWIPSWSSDTLMTMRV